MRKTIEIDAVVDEHGNVHLLETVQLPGSRRASVTILESEPADLHKIEVQFTHPRNDRIFTASVNPLCTGERAINGLLAGNEDGPFLEPAPSGRPYQLSIIRTGNFISPKTTFALAGVIDGDIIEVRQTGQGAGSNLWDTVQVTFAYGVGTGMGIAFIKAIAPIIKQLIENKGKQIVEITWGDKKVKVSGHKFTEVKKAFEELLRADEDLRLQKKATNAQVVSLKPASSKKKSIKGCRESRTIPVSSNSKPTKKIVAKKSSRKKPKS